MDWKYLTARIVEALPKIIESLRRKPKPTPPPVDLPKTMRINFEISDHLTGRPIEGARVRYWFAGDQQVAPIQFTSPGGTTFFDISTDTLESHVKVEAEGYYGKEKHIDPRADMVERIGLEKVMNRKTPEQIREVMTNFANLRDSRGKVQFTPFIGGMPREIQEDWIENEKRNGSSHLVVSVDVNGFNHTSDGELRVGNFYLENRWEEFGELLGRVMRRGLTPIVFVHSGDYYPGKEYFKGFCRWWGEHFSNLTDQVLWVCAWETRRFGNWTAREFNEANLILREELGEGAILAFHGSPESGVFGSNPSTSNREEDDPWMGVGEKENWETECGKEFDVFLFQTRYADDGEEDEFGQPRWWNRTADTVERFLPEGTILPALKGMRDSQNDGGWHYRSGVAGPDWFGGGGRKRGRPTLVAFEYVAWGWLREYLTAKDVERVANKLWEMGFRWFGNGQPTRRG